MQAGTLRVGLPGGLGSGLHGALLGGVLRARHASRRGGL